MTLYVVDASFLIALANRQDSHHKEAVRFEPKLTGATRLIHSIALAEAVTVLTMKVKDDARTARDLFDVIHDNFTILHTTDDLLAQGMALVEKDPQLSLSDALSVVIALERKAQVVSFDGDFDQHAKRVP